MLTMEMKNATYRCDTCKSHECTKCEDYSWAKPLVDQGRKQEVVEKLKSLFGAKMMDYIFTYLKWDVEGAETVELPLEVYLNARLGIRELVKWMEDNL